jgi:hypothetical protein
MPQRLMICTNSAMGPTYGASAEQRNQITSFLQVKGWEVWHWFEDLWFVVVPNGSVTPKGLREEISTSILGNTKYILVLDVSGGQIVYSGFGNKDGWPWMAEKWGKPE